MDTEKLNLSTLGKLSEDDARAMLERIRWPDGPVCPHCGVLGQATAMASDKASKTQLRAGLYNCRGCRKPFSVTVGTIFEGSHIALSKWVLGFYLFATSKKSVSALQLQRQLGLGSYRSAWHMAHRIRHAMQNDPEPAKLSGVLEADETHVGGKLRRAAGLPKWVHSDDGKSTERMRAAQYRWMEKRVPVAVLVSRDGKARTRALDKVTGESLRQFLADNADASRSTLCTDEQYGYVAPGREFSGGHKAVKHKKGEYARGDAHSNTAESFNGLFKRSIQGAWHHISAAHIQRYLDEQVFRWSHRDVDDSKRTLTALGRMEGARLYYKTPEGEEGEAGLVAGR